MSIVPPFISFKKEVVLISGLLEIILGLFLLFKKTRRLSAYGIIILLIAVFPANIYLFISETPRITLGISQEQALIRMPFQIPLILIAFSWFIYSKTIFGFQLKVSGFSPKAARFAGFNKNILIRE